MTWVDYVIIAILALGFISGLRRGFIRTVSSIICLIISIMVAKTYYKTVTVFLVENTAIEEKIAGFLAEKAFVKNMLAVPMGESAVFSVSNSFVGDLNLFVTILIINALSMLIIFMAARFALGIAEGALCSVVKMPGLKEINSMGGAVIGLVKNVIVIMLVFTIITPISAFKFFSAIANGIEQSMLAGYFNNYNFILGWIWSAALDFFNK